MRTLVWLAVGFAAAYAAGVYLAPGMWLLPLAIFCVAMLVVALCLKGKRARTAALILAGSLAGIAWMGFFRAYYLAPALEQDAKITELSAQLTDYTKSSGYGSSAEARIEINGKPYKILIYFRDPVDLSPGSQVEGNFLLRYTADGGAQSATYHQGKGILLLAYAHGEVQVTPAQEVPIRFAAKTLRREISSLIETLFPQDTKGFALALLLGDDSLLDYKTDKALQISGIRHVIAVSGLHVSILFGLVFTLCGKQRYLTAFVGIPVLLLFAALAGFSPSIVRACIMQCIMILALLLNREYDPPTALAAAVLVLLGINPLTITSVSFQLSVGCMVGIFAFATPLSNYFLSRKWVGKTAGKTLPARLKRWLFTGISVTLAAVVPTTPLCAVYFGSISLVGVLTNLLTLWIISFIFYGIMLVCVLGALCAPVGQVIAWILSWPIRYVLMISHFLAQLPMAAIFTCSIYIVLWLVFAYGMFLLFVRNKKQHPALFAACVALGLVAAIVFMRLEHPKDGFSVTVMDVGQGQCILLQSDNDAYLVDCGGTYDDDAADTAIAQLWKRGIYTLDGVVVTHYDKDHAGGIPSLLSWTDTEVLYLPDSTPENALRQELVEQNRDAVSWVRETEEIALGSGTITIYPSQQLDDANESSLCILFQVSGYDILITGDRSIEGEAELLQAVQLPRLELLVVGHHGSATSTGDALLAATQPAMAVISVGEGNSYGHPTAETLNRLEQYGCEVLRTDLEGTITFRGESNGKK